MIMTTNKKTSRLIAVVVVLALVMAMFTGCSAKNEKPEITGVSDFDCATNEQIDLLQRVAAFDKEDGDITPKLKIDVTPKAWVKDGIIVFEDEDEYEVTYSVTDSQGATTTEVAVISTYARDVFKNFVPVDMNGFSVNVSGGAKIESQSVEGDGNNSSLFIKASGAQNDTDAVLARTYTLDGGAEYTFKYSIKSKVAGTVKIKVDNEDAVEYDVTDDGVNELTFTRDLTEATAKTDVKVQLLLGGLGEAIDVEFIKAEVSYEAPDQYLVLTESNVEQRFDGVTGSVKASDDKKSATLKIDTTADADWKGGMFINTGNKLIAGVEYTVAFDVTAKNASEFGVVIQNKQWDEYKYETVKVTKEGLTHKQVVFTPTADNIAGGNGLWLYVMSGNNANEITIANIEIIRGEMPHVSYDIEFVKSVLSPEETTNVTFTKDTNVFDRVDGTAVIAVETADDNSTATLKITTVSDADWHGGMFIKTNCPLIAGVEYKVSFDVVATNADNFAVKLQNKQWGEQEYAFINVEGATESVHKEATFTPTADKVNDGDGLWLYVFSGDHLNEITLSNLKVVKSESSQDGNVYDRFDGVTGTVETAADKSSATLTITQTADADWKGGMFVNTGCTLVSGVEYKVSFDVTAANANKFAVVVQNKQWNEHKYDFISIEHEGLTHKEVTFKPVAENIADGELWLYVQSGDNQNTITVANLTVAVVGEDYSDVVIITDTYSCHNIFKMFAYQGAKNFVKYVDGKLIFEVENFGDTDWHNKIEGPDFDMGTGSFGDYYIMFKAKASAPVQLTVVGPVTGKWDPNVVWARFNLTDTLLPYAIKSNALNEPATHHLEWQFGTTVNQKYENVTIEISDIMICYKSYLD